jgi:hypothetical protein
MLPDTYLYHNYGLVRLATLTLGTSAVGDGMRSYPRAPHMRYARWY